MLESSLGLAHNVSLSGFNTWKVGGCAKNYIRPKSIEELAELFKVLPEEEEILVLGLGSNVLIRDGGFPGTVIHMHRFADEISIVSEDSESILLNIGSGVSCAKIAKFAAKHSLAQAEFFAGIPGTMGGALAMNAGAFGSETWDFVDKVELLSRDGEIKELEAEFFSVGYRMLSCALSSYVFLQATLRFSKKELFIPGKIKELLRMRNQSQPIGLPSCGSVFKNPEFGYAAQFIERSKLKGVRIGGAVVSCKHANFIINSNDSSSQDIESLIRHVQSTVWHDHGVMLQTEVKILGVGL